MIDILVMAVVIALVEEDMVDEGQEPGIILVIQGKEVQELLELDTLLVFQR